MSSLEAALRVHLTSRRVLTVPRDSSSMSQSTIWAATPPNPFRPLDTWHCSILNATLCWWCVERAAGSGLAHLLESQSSRSPHFRLACRILRTTLPRRCWSLSLSRPQPSDFRAVPFAARVAHGDLIDASFIQIYPVPFDPFWSAHSFPQVQ